MRVFGGRPDRVGSGSVPTVHRERRTTVRSVGSESRSLHTPLRPPCAVVSRSSLGQYVLKSVRKDARVSGMPVVVRPTSEVRAELSQITRRFDAGDGEPVFFGSHRRPQAVLVPFATWERLQATSDDGTLGSTGGPTVATRYGSNRPYSSPPADLSMLRGKRSGVVRLPKHLDWGPGRAYQVDDARQRRALYEVVLQEADSPAELEKYVNGQLLSLDWALLRLPPRVRALWEQQFPSLAATA